MRKKKLVSLLTFNLLFLVLPTIIRAQEITVKVIDAENYTSLSGVNVVIKRESTKRTITDINGMYSISVDDPSAVHVFSFNVHDNQEIPVNGRNQIDVNHKITEMNEINYINKTYRR